MPCSPAGNRLAAVLGVVFLGLVLTRLPLLWSGIVLIVLAFVFGPRMLSR